MNNRLGSFYKKNNTCKIGMFFCTVIAIMALATNAPAAVVQRGTTSRPSAVRPNTTARLPTVNANTNTNNTQNNTTTAPTDESNAATDDAPAPAPAEEIIIENKSSQFSTVLDTSSATANDTSENSLAENIRRQRAALDAQSSISAATKSTENAIANGQNTCDTGLRTCMQEKCGKDFTKCKTDTDTTWGGKMDTCRRTTTCSGEEYRMFSAEIKADRDTNATLASYNAILDCGNSYNKCIETQCGQTFGKCLGKSAGDAAIAACSKIAKDCTQQDSGLASRSMSVFGTLRQDAEKQVKKDEERLYELRDLMASQCSRLGAVFDQRSLDCIYTVNFFAANSTTPMASKKLYAGGTFNCDQNWFGVDVTTYKENAYRLTREQESATSALMGSGIGMATGAITSGAINRAIDRQKAEKAVKKAEKEDKKAAKQADKSDADDKADKKESKKQDRSSDKTKEKPDATKKEIEKKAAKERSKSSEKTEEILDKNSEEQNSQPDAQIKDSTNNQTTNRDTPEVTADSSASTPAETK